MLMEKIGLNYVIFHKKTFAFAKMYFYLDYSLLKWEKNKLYEMK